MGTVFSDTRLRGADAALNLGVKVHALADSTTKVRKLGRLFIPLPCRFNSQRVRRCVGMGPQVHGLGLFLRHCQSEFLTCDNYTPIILVSPRGNVDTTPASSAYSIPHTTRRTISNVPSFLGLPSSPFGASPRYTKSETISGSYANLCRTPVMTVWQSICNGSWSKDCFSDTDGVGFCSATSQW